MEAPTVEPIFIRKSQLDIFGGAAPEVPKIPANPKSEKLGNLSVEHKQIYNNLLDKQKKNKLLPEETGHLKNFNQYLSGGITHEQLKGYIGYKQNENHLPLFGNAPEVPKIDAVQKPTVDPVKAATPPLTDPVEPNTEKPQYPHAAFKLLSDEHDEAEGDFNKQRVVNDHAYRLGGDHNSNLRQEIMQAYTGKKVPKAQARMGHVKEAFENWIAKNKGLNKSQLGMFGDEHQPEPTVDPIENKPVKVETKVKSAKNPNHPVLDTTEENNESIMKNLGLHVPELSDMLNEGIDTHKKLNEIVTKAGGHKEPGEYDVDGVKAFDHYPNAGRLYSQYVKSNRSTQEKRDQALNDFKGKLQAAKEYLSNPEPDEHLAKVKEGREAKKKAQLEEITKKQDEMRAMLEARVPENKARMKTYTDNFDFIKKLVPSADPLSADTDPKHYSSSSSTYNEAQGIGHMIHDGISKENITLGKKLHERMEQGKEVNVTPFNTFMRGFGKHHNHDVNSLNESLKEHADAKGDIFYQKKIENLRNHLSQIATEHQSMEKSQLSMFGDEPPKVDPIKVDTPKVDPVKVDTPKVEPTKIDAPKVSSVSGSENFLKPEHKLESEDGVWKVKGDSAATSQLHSWLKDKYRKKEIYTYGGLLNSGHPVAEKIKELHGNDNPEIFDHFNKITGRESGRELGVGENQLRMSLKDSAGMQLGDKHFQVPDLSREAKIERDSFPNGEALHQALNNREVSPELHKWHKDYTFNSYHKKADSGEHYERSLYNNKTEDFGKLKTKPEDNLKPKELERYNALKDAHINEPFTDTHKKRLEDLTAKDNNKKHLSEKFSPEDKKVYDDILKQKEETKALIDSKDLTLAQKEPHKAKQKELHGQETEMLANYRQKLGLGRGDETGQKGFSYTEGLNNDEAKEMDHLTDKQEFTKLHSKYTQAPEENHISKLLKYPMSSNQKVFDDDNQGSRAPVGSKETGLFNDKPAPSKNSAGIDDNEDEGMDPEPDLTDPKQKIESHFPTTGIVSPGSFQKTLKEYGHRPQDSQRPFPANSTIEFNGEKHSIERDGGTHLMTRNLTTGKTDVIHKADVEQFPSDRKIPRIDRYSVEDFMNEHGDEGLSLEDVYSKMGLPDDIKGKDHIKKKLKSALLQLEHHHETGGLHKPKVEREVGKAHPKETDEKEKGILYKLAKSMWDYAAQTISYINKKILIKSYMIDLTIQQKEKSIFEKSLEGKDIYETLMVLSQEEKSLCKTLDNIQAATLMKSGIPLVKFLNDLLTTTTRYVVESGSRFDLLKSMDNGGFQKAVDAAVAYEEEEEKYTTYKYIKPTQNVEDNRDAETEE